jgi:hypothetical protein
VAHASVRYAASTAVSSSATSAASPGLPPAAINRTASSNNLDASNKAACLASIVKPPGLTGAPRAGVRECEIYGLIVKEESRCVERLSTGARPASCFAAGFNRPIIMLTGQTSEIRYHPWLGLGCPFRKLYPRVAMVKSA